MKHSNFRFLLLQVVNPQYQHDEALENMQELQHLVDTFGGDVIEKSLQHRVHPHPATFIGKGKLEWLQETVQEKKIDVVVINNIAKSGQLFRIEQALWKVNTRIQVWDRVDLILHIFDQHAETTEAKLQIELARIQHLGPRIYGLGGTVLSRQGAGIGTRGLGETNSERERRLMKKRTQEVKKRLSQQIKMREGRIRERKRLGIKTVALVGYTSAGKTTLFNTLTKKSKVTYKGLFTTLDSVLGKMKPLQGDVPVLISDTIGFIDNLPPILIDSFHSTLMESLEADLILHVLDAADARIQEKKETVENILKDLQVTQPISLVFNKIDMTSQEKIAELKSKYSEEKTYFVSAKNSDGTEELKQVIRHI